MSKQKPSTIHHVAIVVKDIAKSVDWYLENFDCKIDYQDESWAMLDFKNISLALVLPKQHPPHLGMLVDDASQYGHAQRHRDDTVSVYTKDIDGNSIEYIELPKS